MSASHFQYLPGRQPLDANPLGGREAWDLGAFASDPVQELVEPSTRHICHGLQWIANVRPVATWGVGVIVNDVEDLKRRTDRLGIAAGPAQSSFRALGKLDRHQDRSDGSIASPE